MTADTQVKLGGCSKIDAKVPKSQQSHIVIRFPRHKWPKSGSSVEGQWFLLNVIRTDTHLQDIRHDTQRLLSQSEMRYQHNTPKHNNNYVFYPSQPAHPVTAHPVWHYCHTNSLLIHYVADLSVTTTSKPSSCVSLASKESTMPGLLQVEDLVVTPVVLATGQGQSRCGCFLKMDVANFQTFIEIIFNSCIGFRNSNATRTAFGEHSQGLVEIPVKLLLNLFLLRAVPRSKLAYNNAKVSTYFERLLV